VSLAAVIERYRDERENWRYTNLASLMKVAFSSPPPAKKVSTTVIPSIFTDHRARHHMVFVNGLFRTDLSQLGELPFDIMTGNPTEGYHLALAGETCLVTAPIELIFLTESIETPAEINVKLTITLGKSGRLTLIEHYPTAAGDIPLARIHETDIRLEPQAKLVHGRIINGNHHTSTLARRKVAVAEGAYYENFELIQGGGITRNEIVVKLAGEQAQCALNGVMLLRGSEHADTTTRIQHDAPFGTSQEVYKTILADKGRGVFQGKIVVAKDAQKSDGHQMSRALLLSDQAEMDTKPELEIFADDVKCSHGATTGDLDTDALFYLRARGIDEKEARALLIGGFLDEIIDEIKMPEWRDYCRMRVKEWCDEQK
jgi:Fe-S cluster assembly protein SufD